MSNTIADVVLDNLTYQDIYTATGIAVGTALIVQFKGTGSIRAQVKGFQPASSSTDGVQFLTFEFYVVEAGASGFWCKGTGRLSVQSMA